MHLLYLPYQASCLATQCTAGRGLLVHLKVGWWTRSCSLLRCPSMAESSVLKTARKDLYSKCEIGFLLHKYCFGNIVKSTSKVKNCKWNHWKPGSSCTLLLVNGWEDPGDHLQKIAATVKEKQGETTQLSDTSHLDLSAGEWVRAASTCLPPTLSLLPMVLF